MRTEYNPARCRFIATTKKKKSIYFHYSPSYCLCYYFLFFFHNFLQFTASPAPFIRLNMFEFDNELAVLLMLRPHALCSLSHSHPHLFSTTSTLSITCPALRAGGRWGGLCGDLSPRLPDTLLFMSHRTQPLLCLAWWQKKKRSSGVSMKQGKINR